MVLMRVGKREKSVKVWISLTCALDCAKEDEAISNAPVRMNSSFFMVVVGGFT